MKYAYISILYVIAVVMFLYKKAVVKKADEKHARSVGHLMTAASYTIIAYATAVAVPQVYVCSLLYSLYYAMSDVMLVYMLVYFHEYTVSEKIQLKKWMYVIGSLTAADCISLGLNTLTHHVFTLTEVTDYTGLRFLSPTGFGIAFTWCHMVYVYIMAGLSMFILIHKAVKAPKIYKEKYVSVLICLMAAVAGNVISTVIKLPFDLSLLFYGLVAFGIYFFTIAYTPTNLINSFLSHAVKGLDDAVICYDIEGECIYANDSAKEMFGVQDNSFEPLNTYYGEVLSEKDISEKNMEIWKEKKSNTKKGLRYHEVVYKYLNDDKNLHIGSVVNIHDETAEVRTIMTEQYKSTHDSLTGLFNQAHFYERVGEVLRTARSGEYYMICSNVKDFKLINDTFGIKVGDRILMRISSYIRMLASESTICARLSSDKFAVCVREDRYNEGMFSDTLRQLANIDDIPNYSLCIHLGVYRITDTMMPVSVICDRANMAIKSIKGNYTSSIAHYDDKLRVDYINMQKYTGDFNTAIDEKQFCIYLQPQMSRDGQVMGAEALVRWIHPERGLIPPGEFIEIFERTGLIFKLDMYIWEEACRQLRIWKDDGMTDCSISVNISPKDFYFTNVYDTITKLIEKYDIDPHMLKLEITETAIMSDFKKQMAMIDNLRNYGFEVEMDDFGSGYSSLNMLKDITVDTLKIDMGFLRATNNTEKCEAILKMIIALSRELRMSVITEGVETKDQLDFLADAGCNVFQGYYFSKPIPVVEFEQKYLEKND